MPLQFLEIGFHVEIHAIEWHDFQHETQFHGSCSGMNRIFSYIQIFQVLMFMYHEFMTNGKICGLQIHSICILSYILTLNQIWFFNLSVTEMLQKNWSVLIAEQRVHKPIIYSYRYVDLHSLNLTTTYFNKILPCIFRN